MRSWLRSICYKREADGTWTPHEQIVVMFMGLLIVTALAFYAIYKSGTVGLKDFAESWGLAAGGGGVGKFLSDRGGS